MKKRQEQSHATVPRTGKEFIGTVVSATTAHMVIVRVSHTYRHPLYKKAIQRTKRFAAHNDSLSIALGDTVKIREVRPISKTKHFMVVEKQNESKAEQAKH